MKKNTTKILMAALALFMAIGIATGTTFAWFALNSKVGVTGMEVRTQVSNSILIAPSTTAATAKEADSAFKTNYLVHTENLLEPVSTVDGVTFFYNNSKNVAASGDAIADSYIAYNPASTDDFNTNYNTTGAVGYVDYAFQLKVTNTDTANSYKVNLTQCDLIYAGSATTQKAFRVAVFVNDMGTDGATAATAPSTTSLLTILRPSTAAYFSGDKAVSSATAAPTAVDSKIDDKAIIGTVAHGATNFYKVVVRLWLEGEDTTCNNTTFAALNSSWALNLAVTLEPSDTNAVAAINNTNSTNTADLSTPATVDTTSTKVIDGVTYYEIETVTLGSATLYTTGTTVTHSSLIYTISNDNIITDVTNQCTLPVAP